ncbi:hypothetical protein SDRG_15027 [Saprolegnia diclina VS20]|uniref:Uncharacterized protein n=1 Tax=Saprolegnia diclina (strain VS20) TaxID=1156394 RepID=T0PXZ7_SAPDV|nr:hypothetical protein SDRG_15027 [Saprolegnia diclina VS20]EQC27126.1 hypothetical protein SDRG_15027 [Saprolegnia diclina VS20]|eukprot:XP_008619412.1 hypothetical protein SDRG_15027 [Saprolegnia diclina VS20]
MQPGVMSRAELVAAASAHRQRQTMFHLPTTATMGDALAFDAMSAADKAVVDELLACGCLDVALVRVASPTHVVHGDREKPLEVDLDHRPCDLDYLYDDDELYGVAPTSTHECTIEVVCDGVYEASTQSNRIIGVAAFATCHVPLAVTSALIDKPLGKAMDLATYTVRPTSSPTTICIAFWPRIHRARLVGFRRSLQVLEAAMRSTSRCGRKGDASIAALATAINGMFGDGMDDVIALHGGYDVPDPISFGNTLLALGDVDLLLTFLQDGLSFDSRTLDSTTAWLRLVLEQVGAATVHPALLRLVTARCTNVQSLHVASALLVSMLCLAGRNGDLKAVIQDCYSAILTALSRGVDGAEPDAEAATQLVVHLLRLEAWRYDAFGIDACANLLALLKSKHLRRRLCTLDVVAKAVWRVRTDVSPTHLAPFVAHVQSSLWAAVCSDHDGYGASLAVLQVFGASTKLLKKAVAHVLDRSSLEFGMAALHSYTSRVDVPTVVSTSIDALVDARWSSTSSDGVACTTSSTLPFAARHNYLLHSLGKGLSVPASNASDAAKRAFAMELIAPWHAMVAATMPAAARMRLRPALEVAWTTVLREATPTMHLWQPLHLALPCHCAQCRKVTVFLAEETRGFLYVAEKAMCLHLASVLQRPEPLLGAVTVVSRPSDRTTMLFKQDGQAVRDEEDVLRAMAQIRATLAMDEPASEPEP